MRNLTTLLVVIGFSLRLFLIFPGPFESKVEILTNKADLRNYYWPAQEALRGENPYTLWASGQSGDYRADMAPLELAIYVVTVAIWNDPRAIQVLFALFDALNIALLAVLLKSSLLKLPFQIFYALGPLTVYNLTLVPQDKTILFALIFTLLYFLRRFLRGESRFAFYIVLTAALIAAFKWLSVFYLLPLLICVSRDVRDFIKHGMSFAVWVALAHLPWFPSWSYVYAFRSARIATPLHIAPAALLNELGIYAPPILLTVLGISLLVIYALYWVKRIDIFETIALATTAGILWTPDMDPVHLSIVVLMLLLVFDWSTRARLGVIWILSAGVSTVYEISTHAQFVRLGLQALTGAYASPRMILLSYSLFIIVFAFYLWDKRHGRAVGRAVIEPGIDQP